MACASRQVRQRLSESKEIAAILSNRVPLLDHRSRRRDFLVILKSSGLVHVRRPILVALEVHPRI